MKKLSPPEPILNILLTLEIPRNIPTTKIKKIIENNYGFKTRLIPPYTLKIPLRRQLGKNNIDELLQKLSMLSREIPSDIDFCIEYWILFKNIKCICKDTRQFMNTCIMELDGKTIYIYCNNKEKYISIKFFKTKPVSTVDPLQVTRSSFIYCDKISKLNTYVNIIKNTIPIIDDLRKSIVNDFQKRI